MYYSTNRQITHDLGDLFQYFSKQNFRSISSLLLMMHKPLYCIQAFSNIYAFVHSLLNYEEKKRIYAYKGLSYVCLDVLIITIGVCFTNQISKNDNLDISSSSFSKKKPRATIISQNNSKYLARTLYFVYCIYKKFKKNRHWSLNLTFQKMIFYFSIQKFHLF